MSRQSNPVHSREQPPWRTYRRVEDISAAWIPSPVVEKDERWQHVSSKGKEKAPARADGGHKKKRRRAFCGLLPWRFVGRGAKETASGPKNSAIQHPLPESAWRSYGYWARPIVNGVLVNNSTPRQDAPRELDFNEAFHELRGPNGSPHSERWPPQTAHPCLPPRPAFWETPDPRQPLPFPWECELNPFLKHVLVGTPPLFFNINYPPSGISHGRQEGTIPLTPADHAQPATHPFLTHMHIIGVADDPMPVFPWPVMITNASGITCEDVFLGIHENFQRFVTKTEYESWPKPRQEWCSRAYYARKEERLRMFPDSPEPEDGLRRVDYMGDRMLFRGVAPSPIHEGAWIIFLGPE